MLPRNTYNRHERERNRMKLHFTRTRNVIDELLISKTKEAVFLKLTRNFDHSNFNISERLLSDYFGKA